MFHTFYMFARFCVLLIFINLFHVCVNVSDDMASIASLFQNDKLDLSSPAAMNFKNEFTRKITHLIQHVAHPCFKGILKLMYRMFNLKVDRNTRSSTVNRIMKA